MVVFSPDGTYAFVCSSFTAMTVVVDTAAKKVVAHVPQVGRQAGRQAGWPPMATTVVPL